MRCYQAGAIFPANVTPFYRGGNQGSGRLVDLAESTQPAEAETGVEPSPLDPEACVGRRPASFVAAVMP